MVTTLNITLDDETHAAATEAKEARDLTWAEFIEVAADELAEPSRGDTPAHDRERAGEPPTGGRRVDAGPTTAVDFSDAVDDAVSHMAGGDELPDTRTPALREAVTQLRRDGAATVDDLVSGAYRREAGGYTAPDSYRRSITSALDALAERRSEIGTDGDRYVWHGGEA